MTIGPILALDVRERLRATTFWVLGVLFMVVVTVASYPAVRDNPALASFAEDLPELVRALIGEDLVSPAGYLNSQLYLSVLPIVFIVLGIGRASSTLAGEEQDGVLELTVALPVTRRRVLLEKFGGVMLALAMMLIATWLSTWLGAELVSMDISGGAVAAATVSTALLALAVGTVTFAVGAATGRRGLAVGVGSAVAAASWLLYGLAPLLDADTLVQLSLWDHAYGADPLANGFDWSGSLALLAVSVAAFLVAVVTFERRDLGTA